MDDYPLLNLFFTILWFFLLVAWISLLIVVLGDVLRSRDLSGWAKGLWALFMVVLPWIGVLVYLGVRGASMQQRAAEYAAAREPSVTSGAHRTTGGGRSTADELAKLAELHEAGQLTDDEFASQKVKVLAG